MTLMLQIHCQEMAVTVTTVRVTTVTTVRVTVTAVTQAVADQASLHPTNNLRDTSAFNLTLKSIGSQPLNFLWSRFNE